MKRVTSAWNLERATVSVQKKRDKRHILNALYHADARGYDTGGLLSRRFPDWKFDDTNTLPETVIIKRDETPVVVGVLGLAAQEMQSQRRELERVESLIGKLVVAGESEFYPNPVTPAPMAIDDGHVGEETIPTTPTS
jgi:hypothetical protein